jgi:hypothetical protein
MYDLVQFNIGNCVEIKGIPKTTNENCTDIVQAISKKINLDVSIKSTFRIHSTSTNTSIFVVDFNSLDMKKKFIRKVKTMKINAKMISNRWSEDLRIYANDTHKIQKKFITRNACKDKNFKYVWTNNAEILVKKVDGVKNFLIKSDEDIINLYVYLVSNCNIVLYNIFLLIYGVRYFERC